MTKTHCLNPVTKCGTELLPTGYEMTDNVANADAVLIHGASIYGMELLESLSAVGRAGAGVNNIPPDSCTQKGIVVSNTPGINVNGVGGLVVAGMLIASRDIVDGTEWCKADAKDDNVTKDTEKSKKAFAGCEIKGKKLGVIGLGAVGTKVANVVTHLGIKVYGYDPRISINTTQRLSRNIKHITNAGIIFWKYNYITIHVPLMNSTRGMINKEKLAIMKDGVIVLNFSGDTLVNDDDMAVTLDTGKVRYYISDFPNPKVTNMERVTLLPHLGASIEESEDNCAVMAVRRLADYLENGNIKDSVNLPSCDMGIRQAESRVTVLCTNILNMVGQIMAILAEQGMSISDMTSKSRDRYVYTLLDLEHKAEDSTIRKLRAIEGVPRIRVVK